MADNIAITNNQAEAEAAGTVQPIPDLAEITTTSSGNIEHDETSRSLWQAVLTCEEELAKNPSQEQTIDTAQRILQYYHNLPAGRKDSSQLLRALELAEKAEKFPTQSGKPDPCHISFAIYLQGRMFRLLYLDTNEITWLNKAIQRTRDSIEATSDNHYPSKGSYRYVLALRYDSLAMMLESLYLITFVQGPEIPDDPVLYNDLVAAAYSAAEHTAPEDYESHLTGETFAYDRMLRYFRVKYMGLTSDNSDLNWERMIEMASLYPGSKWPCHDASKVNDGPTNEQAWAVIEIMARRWASTRNAGHEEALLDYFRTNVTPGRSDESIFYSLSLITQSRLTGREEHEGTFRFHLPTLNVTKALWEKYLLLNEPKANEFWPSLTDFQGNYEAVCDLAQIQQRIYRCTKDTLDAWAFDDLIWQATRKMFLWEAWNSETSEYKFPAINTGPLQITVVSAIDGESKVDTWWVPGMSLTRPRLSFLMSEQDETPSVNNWISDRTPDGRFVLGGPIEGRDDDVLRFLSDDFPSIGNAWI